MLKVQQMLRIILPICACFFTLFASCQEPDEDYNPEIDFMEEEINTVKEQQAVVVSVEIEGSENNYTFKVTIESPDTGCKQYADWWEVFDQEGNLIYRRILGHSHVDEQPFTRSGGPVQIKKDQFVYVRAHMNTLGYGSYGFGGTVEKGLMVEMIGLSIGADLEKTAPLPKDCDF